MKKENPSESGLASCPNCAEAIRANAIICRFCQSGLSLAHFRKCPKCAEMVRRKASRCRFCQSNIADLQGGEPPQEAPVPRSPQSPTGSSSISLPVPNREDNSESISSGEPKIGKTALTKSKTKHQKQKETD